MSEKKRYGMLEMDEAQKKRLMEAKTQFGDYIPPSALMK